MEKNTEYEIELHPNGALVRRTLTLDRPRIASDPLEPIAVFELSGYDGLDETSIRLDPKDSSESLDLARYTVKSGYSQIFGSSGDKYDGTLVESSVSSGSGKLVVTVITSDGSTTTVTDVVKIVHVPTLAVEVYGTLISEGSSRTIRVSLRYALRSVASELRYSLSLGSRILIGEVAVTNDSGKPLEGRTDYSTARLPISTSTITAPLRVQRESYASVGVADIDETVLDNFLLDLGETRKLEQRTVVPFLKRTLKTVKVEFEAFITSYDPVRHRKATPVLEIPFEDDPILADGRLELYDENGRYLSWGNLIATPEVARVRLSPLDYSLTLDNEPRLYSPHTGRISASNRLHFFNSSERDQVLTITFPQTIYSGKTYLATASTKLEWVLRIAPGGSDKNIELQYETEEE